MWQRHNAFNHTDTDQEFQLMFTENMDCKWACLYISKIANIIDKRDLSTMARPL